MGWLLAIAAVIAVLGVAMYLRRRRADQRAELEAREAWRDRLFGILDPATVEHLYESPEFAELRTFFANTFHEDLELRRP